MTGKRARLGREARPLGGDRARGQPVVARRRRGRADPRIDRAVAGGGCGAGGLGGDPGRSEPRAGQLSRQCTASCRASAWLASYKPCGSRGEEERVSGTPRGGGGRG